jgi:hypothetical protein
LSRKIAGKADVTINQEAVEAEDFHFFGGFDAGGGLPYIVKFASLRSANEVKRIALRIEMRLSEERWDQGKE